MIFGIFWLCMLIAFFIEISKEQKGKGFLSQFDLEEDPFKFQQKKFIFVHNNETVGILDSFFSLSETISFEINLKLNYKVKSQKYFQKIYGKIIAERLRLITDVFLIIKSSDAQSNNAGLTSFRGKFNDNIFHYDIVEKKEKKREISGDIKVKGRYWLINPVFPFGRNLKALKDGGKHTAIYDPMREKYEKIEYKIVNRAAEVDGKKTVEVQANIYGMYFKLFLSPAGELLKASMPGEFYIAQVEPESKVEVNGSLDIEKLLNQKREPFI